MDLEKEIEKGGVARHETFTPRYGWLKKGFDAILKDSKVFSAPDVIEILGVGKNMTRSIRSWCLATHILEYEEGQERKGRKGRLRPTTLAKKIFLSGGWDPYLEDIATLWLLHWNIFIPPIEAASWSIVFNYCHLRTFDNKQLEQFLIGHAKNYDRLSTLSEGSFKKDASCIIRMYAPQVKRDSRGIDCPFTQIGLIRAAEEPGVYRFNVSEKSTLPALIFAAACFSYAMNTQPDLRTLSLHKVVHGFNCPGLAFKLSETEAGRLLYKSVKSLNNVEFVDSLGNQQLQFDIPPEDLYWQALELYYNTAKGREFSG